MEQTMIYDFLGSTQDPLYQELEQMKIGESINFKEITITLNRNCIYEITSEDIHKGFSDMFECYRYLNKLLKEK